MKKLFISLFFLFCSQIIFSQSADTAAGSHVKKFLPGIMLGADYTGFWTGEAGIIFGINAINPNKQTKITSTMMHGPALRCEFGNLRDTFLLVPKVSYEYYSMMLGAKITLADYMRNNSHNLYLCPEAGITMGTMLNLYAGVNIPVSGEVQGVKMLRLSATIDLLFLYFKKHQKQN